jgi:3-phenylpropionate/trans-cinnamate dioxygenase ferredoxin reductase subunit
LQTIIGELRLTFHAGVAVTRLYAGEKRLVFSDGTEGRFDKILISTGAKPFVPLPAGYPEDAVYVMRTIADAERLRSRLEKKDSGRRVIGRPCRH